MKIIRISELKEITGLSRTAIYKKMSEGKFPKNIKLGARAVGWLSSDVDDWITSLIAENAKISS